VSITTLSSALVYENPWLAVREDQVEYADGSRGTQSVVDRPDFALVLPAERDGFHLVEQYRYATGLRSWEFPSGSWPPGHAGSVEEMAAAELAEETGHTARHWHRLGDLHVANGTTGQVMHVFLATDLTAGAPQREVAEQDMRSQWFPRAEVERMLRDGTITDAPSLAAYLLLTLKVPTV
jgi:8-oxo-dGTP pyrophosphatase MutT (NUDIX family)